MLGVNDEARQGALRFSQSPHDTLFLAPKNTRAIPPLINLPQLLSATTRYLEDNESSADMKLLLAPGSSLGGARPKASIRDQDGHLTIAKFQKKEDEFNTILWEAVALTLAKNAGITTSEWQLKTILNMPVLLIKRFDRIGHSRIPFLSAMSMLDTHNQESHSYLDIVYALHQHGSAPKNDCKELWRRIVFSIMIANTDDHLRNHGFLYERYKGWRLSPAYDLNPIPTHIKPRILSTNISLETQDTSLHTAMHVIHHFGLSENEAQHILQNVRSAVSKWRQVAKDLGLSTQECDRMASAFNTSV